MADQLTTRDLIAWLAAQTWSEFAQSLAAQAERTGGILSERQIAAAHRMYATCARRAAERIAPPVTHEGHTITEGFYLVNGWLWRVKRSQRGNLYAMTRGEHGGWEFVRGGMRHLEGCHEVTPDEAIDWGHATGRCLFCDAELDDREGLGALVGVGPVCARTHLGMTQRQLAEHRGITI